MGTSRRPGRIQRIAYDETPLGAAKPDLDARIGWLLAMSRLHHQDGSFQDGHTFTEALADAGVRVSRSLLSRWESGDIPITYEGMSAYEVALGLEPGRISSLTGYIRTSLPSVASRVVRPKLDPSTVAFADRFDYLLDVAEEGGARAHDWQQLGWHLAAAPMIHLRAKLWRVLARRLVQQLPRTTKLTFRQYTTAAVYMAAIPRAQDFLADAIADYIADPDVQVVTSPVGLLGQLPTRHAAQLVLGIIERPPHDGAFRLGVWLAAQKIARGHFTPEERSALDMLVLRLWRADPAKAAEQLAELIAGLPTGLRSTLVDAAARAGRDGLGYAVLHGEEATSAEAATTSERVAEGARGRVPQDPTYAEDRMLVRLVREAIFHRDLERRHLAGLLIATSPFDRAVADELLDLLADPSQPEVTRVRSASLVRYLAADQHRMRMLSFMSDPVEHVAVGLTQGLGHLTASPTSDVALRTSLRSELSPRDRALMYALGMTGSTSLRTIERSSVAPGWQRSAARWWLAHGSAIHT